MAATNVRSVLALLVPVLVLWGHLPGASSVQDPPAPPASQKETAMLIRYLEIVTPDVDAACKSLEKIHGVRFGQLEAALGNARTAPLAGGGRIGVRAPLRADEAPVVRPYLSVDDVEAAVQAAAAAGGEIALPATDIPGVCTFAIYFQGGIQYGLWKP